MCQSFDSESLMDRRDCADPAWSKAKPLIKLRVGDPMGLGLSSKGKTASWAQGQWITGAANPSRFRRSSRRGLYVQGWGGSCGSCGGATHPGRSSLGDLVQLLGLASAMVISAVKALPFFGADFAGQEGPGQAPEKLGHARHPAKKRAPSKEGL
jgi:hypothetical protein